MKGYVYCAAIVVSLLALTSDVRAVLVTSTTHGTLFYDDFEGLGDAVSHAPYQDNSGDYDPVAVVGSWTVGEDYDSAIQVTDSTISPDPGPAQGDDYLRLNRPSGFAPAYANLSQALTLAEDSGDTLHIDLMFNVASTVTVPPALVSLFDNGGAVKTQLLVHGNGTIINRTGTVDTTLEVDYTADDWARLELDYVIGAETYSVTINGATVSGLGLYQGSGSGVSRVRMAGNPGGGTYYDATPVPEPSTIALLLSAAFGGLAVRRRRARMR